MRGATQARSGARWLALALPLLLAGRAGAGECPLAGRWRVTEVETNGTRAPAAAGCVWEFRDGKAYFILMGKVRSVYAYRTDTRQKPAHIDLAYVDEPGKAVRRGIFRVEGDRLRWCFQARADGPRPEDFSGKVGERQTLRILERIEGRPVRPAGEGEELAGRNPRRPPTLRISRVPDRISSRPPTR